MICLPAPCESAARRSLFHDRERRLDAALRAEIEAFVDATGDLARALPALIDHAVRAEAERVAIESWDEATRRAIYVEAAHALRRIMQERHDVEHSSFGVALHKLDVFEHVCPDDAETFLLRIFAGRTLEEVAELTESDLRTTRRRWEFARAWVGATVHAAA